MDNFDDLLLKPSKQAHKRSKHGVDQRCGATLRRYAVAGIQKSRDASLIVKHVVTAEGWQPKDVGDQLLVDDGGIFHHGWYKGTNQRGKSAKSVLAKHPVNGLLHLKSSYVTYSMNKRKRWLLADQLRDEIQREKVCGTGEWNTEIDLTVIEREVGANTLLKNFSLRPDTVDVASSTLQDKEDFPKRKRRKTKRKTYSCSTDLLRLSQKPEKDSDNEAEDLSLKPEVVYEVCHTRTAGPYNQTMNSDVYCNKPKNKRLRRKRDLRNLAEEAESNTNTNNDETSANDVTSASERSLPSIGSWIDRAAHIKTQRYTRKHSRNATPRPPAKPAPKKGRVIYETKEPLVVEDNKHTPEETFGDSFLNRVVEAEEASSVITKVSLQSLLELSHEFLDCGADVCSFRGLTVSKSRSLPVKYAFELKNQISVKLPNNEVSSSLGYFVLHPLKDHSGCSSDCYSKHEFCKCCEYLPVRVKLVVLSEEESHQQYVRFWGKKLKEIFSRQNPSCPGVYLTKIINIVNNVYEDEVPSPDMERKEIPKKKILSVLKSTSRNKKVIDEVSSLLGFAVKPVDDACLRSMMDQQDGDVKANHSPSDHCEICWTSLSDQNKDFEFLSLTQCCHLFCHDCWRRHLITVTRSSATKALKCPGYNCDVIIDDVTMMAYLPGSILSRYQNRLLKNTIKRSTYFHHCPRCSRTVEVANSEYPKMLTKAMPLSCTCGARWCSKCKDDPHWPASCDQAEAYRNDWKEKCRVPTAAVSGRRCPACHEPIEKDGGCQMMSCTCGHEFCWKCMKSFDDCMYTCNTGDYALEEWELTSVNTIFAQAVLDAATTSKNFQCIKTHRKRLAACQKRAWKIASAQTVTQRRSFDNQFNIGKDLESKLQDVLVQCNALHHIIQYLTIANAVKKRRRRNPRTKLQRIRVQLQMAVENIEQSIFDEKSTDIMTIEEGIEKKMTSAKSLLNYLIICVNQLL